MKRSILMFALALCFSSVDAQTAKIAHGSHSGSHKSFNPNSADSFGLPSGLSCKKDSTNKANAAKADSLAKKKKANPSDTSKAKTNAEKKPKAPATIAPMQTNPPQPK